MPRQKRKKPLYQRGDFRLYRREDRENLEIVWYDNGAGRERSRSAGSSDVGTAKKALDALYLQKSEGVSVCPTCKRPWDQERRFLVTQCIADYLVAREGRDSIGSIRPRLAHVVNFMQSTDRIDTSCADIDEDWVDTFREWAGDVPIVSPSGIARARTPSTVEASVRQLKAAINFSYSRHDTPYPASFSPKPPRDVDNTPTFRASIEDMILMFRYATRLRANGKPMAGRLSLLRFLQLSVATWARPSTVMEFSTDPKFGQWISAANVARLNPKGRPQTRKYRPDVPVPARMASILSSNEGYFVGVESVRTSYEAMIDEIGLTEAGKGELRLIRRSMATIARNMLGEDFMAQIERMMGHRKSSSTDIYALQQPSQLGRCLEVTEHVINEITKAVPAAFHRDFTALKLVKGA